MAEVEQRNRKMSGEQRLALAALWLITGLILATLLIVAMFPTSIQSLIPLASLGVTAIASLVRRHDIQDVAASPVGIQDTKAP